MGYVVNEKREGPDPDKIAVIDGLPTPTNVKGIAKLLGHEGGDRELILNFSKIVVPITQLFGKDCKFEWTEACQKAFKEFRDKLSTSPMLTTPDWDKCFHVFCDCRALLQIDAQNTMGIKRTHNDTRDLWRRWLEDPSVPSVGEGPGR